MDYYMKRRYQAWCRRRILKRLIMLIVIIVVGSWGYRTILGHNSDDEQRLRPQQRDSRPVENPPVIGDPQVYIFNSHPLEMIGSTSDNLFAGDMSIVELSYVLADYLASHGIGSIIEQRCVDRRLHANNWEFYMSYYAARAYLLDTKNQHPSLEFFVDLHRDGIPHRYATAQIDGQSYARILFVIGSDNPRGHQESYNVARQLHAMLETLRPGISRGVFMSGGWGHDGIYNQDVSPHVQLIELGTYTSSVAEVVRSIAVLAEVLANYINNSNNN